MAWNLETQPSWENLRRNYTEIPRHLTKRDLIGIVLGTAAFATGGVVLTGGASAVGTLSVSASESVVATVAIQALREATTRNLLLGSTALMGGTCATLNEISEIPGFEDTIAQSRHPNLNPGFVIPIVRHEALVDQCGVSTPLFCYFASLRPALRRHWNFIAHACGPHSATRTNE